MIVGTVKFNSNAEVFFIYIDLVFISYIEWGKSLNFFCLLQIITKMAAANGVRRVWVGQNSLMATPAVSAVIRERIAADVSLISDKGQCLAV